MCLFDTAIPQEDMEDAVKSSRLVNKQAESICHQLMLTTPTILQDLKVLPQLSKFYIVSS
jgi:hypothetical protein